MKKAMNMNKVLNQSKKEEKEVSTHKQSTTKKGATYVEYGDNFCPKYETCLKKFMRDLKMFSISMSVMYEITRSDFETKLVEKEKNVFTLDLDLENKKVNKIVYVPHSDTYLIYVDHFGFANFLQDRLKRYLLLSGNDLKSTYLDCISEDIYVVEMEIGNHQNIANNEFFDIKTMTL
jgi:hypothetical protein